MSLVEQYRRQFSWCDSPRALALFPMTRGQQVSTHAHPVPVSPELLVWAQTNGGGS